MPSSHLASSEIGPVRPLCRSAEVLGLALESGELYVEAGSNV